MEKIEHGPLLKYHILVLIAQYGNATRVAEVLGLTQPTVTFHMKSLETYYGVPLFEHFGRRTILTDAGKALLIYAERILTYVQEADRVLKEYRETIKGNLRIGASAVPATYLLPAWIAFHYRMLPEVHIATNIMATPFIVEQLLERTLDLGIIAEETYEPLSVNHALERVPVCTDRLVLVYHPSLHLTQKIVAQKEMTKEALSRLPFVLHSQTSSTRQYINRWATTLGIELHVLFELPSAEAVKQAVVSGVGAAILSEMAVRQELTSGMLKTLPLPAEGTSLLVRDISLLYHRERYQSPLFDYVRRSLLTWVPNFCEGQTVS
ncbi:MAG: LysR family transcriptional regulator [Candidatus Carbobacillus altaicus]|nr:LysR family transcriptional regulator [Candidatus Carbobacillus altaicus]